MVDVGYNGSPTESPIKDDYEWANEQELSMSMALETAIPPVTDSPSKSPSASPSKKPTVKPTVSPSGSPSKAPVTNSPTNLPSKSPVAYSPSKPTMVDVGYNGSPTESPIKDDYEWANEQELSMSMALETASPSDPTTSLSNDPTSPPATSSTSNDPTFSPTTSAFSTNVFLALDGITEEMDDAASASLENVTQTFLGEQFTDSMEVSEVTVWSQSIVEEEGDERKLKHGNLGRNVLQKSLRSLETSTSSSLYIELVVDGTVLDWQALESSVESPKDGTNREIDDNSIRNSIATAIESSLSSNNDDFKTRLAHSSDFFLLESSKSILEPTAAIKPKGEGNTIPITFMIIVAGAAVALGVLVGTMFYMDLKSDAKQQRALEPS